MLRERLVTAIMTDSDSMNADEARGGGGGGGLSDAIDEYARMMLEDDTESYDERDVDLTLL